MTGNQKELKKRRQRKKERKKDIKKKEEGRKKDVKMKGIEKGRKGVNKNSERKKEK